MSTIVSYIYPLSTFTNCSTSDIYYPDFIQKIQNEPNIGSLYLFYEYDPINLIIYFSDSLSDDQQLRITNIISLYNFTFTLHNQLQSLESKPFIGGTGVQCFGTNTLSNGNMDIGLTEPLSSNPIILLSVNNSSSTPGTGSYLTYYFTPGYPVFTVVSSDPNDISQFSWFIAKY